MRSVGKEQWKGNPAEGRERTSLFDPVERKKGKMEAGLTRTTTKHKVEKDGGDS